MKNHGIKTTTTGIRVILYLASLLVLTVGITLYFFSEKTDVYFSWTINPPLSAAFLGGGYLASFILELLSARERTWARARIAVPGVWVFTTLTFVVTLLHWDRFHFDSPVWITRAGTWFWLAIYIGVPIALGLFWIVQNRQPGGDPPKENTLPVWFRLVLVLQGAVMFLIGGIMLILPDIAISFWPWRLYTLTAQAFGAWGLGIGVIVLHASWENDWDRLFPMMLSYTFYGALQGINVIRFSSSLDWSGYSSAAYTVFILSILLVGAYGTWRAWRINR
jgi:hypothetical protein